MTMTAVPEHYRNAVVSHIMVDGAADAIAFYARAFGAEELYRLDLDPTEQRNLAANERARCARLRQRLAAWAEANRRQYGPAGKT